MTFKHTLKIIPFKNPSGNLVSRMTGTISGHSVQKNFPTRDAAEVFMDGLIRSANQGKSAPTRAALTIFQTDQELHTAELAYQRLRTALPTGFPVYRTHALLEQLKGRLRVPAVLFYPGELEGPTGLKFMGVLDADPNYRPRIF